MGDNNNLNLDDFKLDNGFSINEVESKAVSEKPKKHRKNTGLKTALWIISIIVVSVGIAVGAIYAGADYLGLGFGRGGNCTIEIERGSATVQIAEKLNENGVVKIPFLFRVFAKLKHYDGKFKYGVYTFDSELGYSGIADMLMNEGAKAQSVSVTIVEGTNVDGMAKLLEEKGVCKKADFIDVIRNGKFDYDFIKEIPENSVYYRLEGYLFPDTYDFYNYESEECAYLAVDKMLKTLDEKLKKAKIDPKNITINSNPYTLHQILSMASIVQMEASSDKAEMNNVAAVFFNRLESPDFQTLGSSPTRKYPYGDGKYNTYECKGLPVGPLCSPGLDAIKATCSPSENFDYYYFVTDAQMKFYYNKTLSQHNSIIAKLKAEKNWIYED